MKQIGSGQGNVLDAEFESVEGGGTRLVPSNSSGSGELRSEFSDAERDADALPTRRSNKITGNSKRFTLFVLDCSASMDGPKQRALIKSLDVLLSVLRARRVPTYLAFRTLTNQIFFEGELTEVSPTAQEIAAQYVRNTDMGTPLITCGVESLGLVSMGMSKLHDPSIRIRGNLILVTDGLPVAPPGGPAQNPGDFKRELRNHEGIAMYGIGITEHNEGDDPGSYQKEVQEYTNLFTAMGITNIFSADAAGLGEAMGAASRSM